MRAWELGRACRRIAMRRDRRALRGALSLRVAAQEAALGLRRVLGSALRAWALVWVRELVLRRRVRSQRARSQRAQSHRRRDRRRCDRQTGHPWRGAVRSQASASRVRIYKRKLNCESNKSQGPDNQKATVRPIGRQAKVGKVMMDELGYTDTPPPLLTGSVGGKAAGNQGLGAGNYRKELSVI